MAKSASSCRVGERIYSVEPHARLGPENGAIHPCEPDFLISQDRPDPNSDRKARVAVFLDGYSYHKDIVDEDLMKRQGISLGSDTLTWSLTWPDINGVLTDEEVKIPNALRQNIKGAPKDYIREISAKKGLQEHEEISKLPPLLMLVKFLANPNIEKWRDYAMLRALCWLDQARMQSTDERTKFEAQYARWPGQYVDAFSAKELLFCSSNKLAKTPAEIDLYIAGEQEAITELSHQSLILAGIFSSGDTDDPLVRTGWQTLLQLMNIGQFLPLFFAGTAEGIANGSFARPRMAQAREYNWCR